MLHFIFDQKMLSRFTRIDVSYNGDGMRLIEMSLP